MQARFLEPARTEVEEAIVYFDEQRPGLGDRFEHDLGDIVAFITARPLSGKQLTYNVRQVGLRTFRYNVIYAVDGEELIIVAVAHHRRRPGYWLGRLSHGR
jgi:hypothetical protein